MASPSDTSSTIESLFASEFVPSQHRSGLRTSRRTSPTWKLSPRTGCRSGTPSWSTDVRNARYCRVRESGGVHTVSNTTLVGNLLSTAGRPE